MAVETTLYSGKAQYYNGSISKCVGGGEDYRTVGKNETVNAYLFCLCDMTGLSSACRISRVDVSFKSRYTLTSNTAGWGNYNVKANAMMYYSMPSISGTEVNPSTGAHGSAFASYNKNKVDSSSSYASYSFGGSPADSAVQTIYGGGKGLACAHFPLSHNGNLDCRIWLKDCTFTVTRTRACYVTFQGDGITAKRVMYDYGAVPSYGSAPSRSGYIFKGWQSAGTTYTDALPSAGETDVIYTAVWEEVKYYLDLNGFIDGEPADGISPAGTADVYINGALVSEDCADYYAQHGEGSSYEIKNITANDGYGFIGVKSGSLSGTLTGDTAVVLEFKRVSKPPVIAKVSMTYNSKAVGIDNKVFCGEGFLISVELS